jgi:rod shape-determining protein MreB and related proteins
LEAVQMLAQQIGIDAGSARTLVVTGRREVQEVPSVVALHRKTRAVVAVGEKASEMVGKEPDHLVAIHPIRAGSVADLDGALALFRFFLRRTARSRLLRPRVLLGVPGAATQMQVRALTDLAFEAGASEIHLLDETVAAALGAHLPVGSPQGTLLVNVGAGRSTVSVISLGSPVVTALTDAAGYMMDDAIARHIRQEHNLMVGERSAERVKIDLGAVETIPVTGRNLATGLPLRISLRGAEIESALEETFARLELTVRRVLEQTPPELMADIAVSGMTLVGGGALTRGLAERLGQATGLAVRLAPDPVRAAALGMRRLMQEGSALAPVRKVQR